MQTVYLSVLDGKARYDGRSTFRTWLFGVIRLTSLSRQRSDWVRRLLLERNSNHVAVPSAVSADAEAERRSRSEKLRGAMARLAARQREVLQLVFFHDLTVEEAANIMGISVGSARTHYARGKDRMAVLLGSKEEL